MIALLLVAIWLSVRNAGSIGKTAAGALGEQEAAIRLLEDLRREQDAINAAFYQISREPAARAGRKEILAQLDDADRAIDRLIERAKGSPQRPLWDRYDAASLAFSNEARRLLELDREPPDATRSLFRLHEEVTRLATELIAAVVTRTTAAQSAMELKARTLAREALVLGGACFLVALLTAVGTLWLTRRLVHDLEAQAGELARVSWHLLDSQETVARRFSHELHDELGGALTAIRTNLRALASDPADGSRLEDCGELVDGAISSVRELSQLLRPTILDDLGLDASLRWLCDGFRQRTRIEVLYQSDMRERPPENVETQLFRIAQEALTNVARHAAASKVEVSLNAAGNEIKLFVTDNGKGLPPAPSRSGMGLTGMRARARTAGGTLTIDSAPAKGTALVARIPVR